MILKQRPDGKWTFPEGEGEEARSGGTPNPIVRKQLYDTPREALANLEARYRLPSNEELLREIFLLLCDLAGQRKTSEQ